MAHTFIHNLMHLVFSTKDRLPILDNSIRPRTYDYIGGILRELGGIMIAVNGTDNHVHILAALPADKSISEIMRIAKANSSHWIHNTFPDHETFAWQVGYGAFSVSQSHKDDVCKYIATQIEHHKRMTFEEEFIAFLKRHHIEYDPQMLWK